MKELDLNTLTVSSPSIEHTNTNLTGQRPVTDAGPRAWLSNAQIQASGQRVSCRDNLLSSSYP